MEIVEFRPAEAGCVPKVVLGHLGIVELSIDFMLPASFYRTPLVLSVRMCGPLSSYSVEEPARSVLPGCVNR